MTHSGKKIFLVSCLVFMLLPSLYIINLKDPGKGLAGVEARNGAPAPRFNFKEYRNKQYQNDFEKWIGREFFGRNFLFRLRNTTYYLANFGHFTYRIFDVLNTKTGQLFGHYELDSVQKKKYLANLENTKGTFEAVLKLQKILEHRGKKFIFTMAGSKTDYFADQKTAYLKFFDDPNEFDISKIYEDNFKQLGVNYFNGSEYTKSKRGKGPEAYSFSGIHLNHVGCADQMFAIMHKIEKIYAVKYSLPSIEKISYSDVPTSREADIANLQNMLFQLKKSGYQYPYYEYKKSGAPALNMCIISDSFGLEFKDRIFDSGISDAAHTIIAENEYTYVGLPKEKVKEMLARCDLFIALYSDPNMLDERVKRTMNSITAAIE